MKWKSLFAYILLIAGIGFTLVCTTPGSIDSDGDSCMDEDGNIDTNSIIAYRITVVSAKNLPGDFWSACDPYVEISDGNKTFSTPTKDDTNNPIWNYSFICKRGIRITFNIIDEDVSDDDWIATYSFIVDGITSSTSITISPYSFQLEFEPICN